MSRYTRKSAVLAKLEVTYGTDAAPSGAANAILVSNQTINPLNAQNVERDIVRPYFGASEQLVGTAYVEVSFDVELVGSGAAGTAPAWAPLLRACGLAETLTATTRADYTPITDGIESLTLYYFDDGVVHKLLGARGSAQITAKLGEVPKLKFRFIGAVGGVLAQANPAVTLTAFKTPQVVTNQNSGDVVLGATHQATGAPALAGGTPYTSQGIELDLGNALNFTPLCGEEGADISDRKASGRVTIDCSAAQEVALFAAVQAATLTSLGFTHGTAPGCRVLFFMPAVQLINPQKADANGRRLITYDLRLTPVNGNDELRIATSY